MKNILDVLSKSDKWRLLINSAKEAVRSQGYALERVPGRVLSNLWHLTRNGQTQRACVCPTQDRLLSFLPLDEGRRWKVLDEVDVVIIASFDDGDRPENVDVFLCDANEIQKIFDSTYSARTKAGQSIKDGSGMWVRFDPDNRELPICQNACDPTKYEKIASYEIFDLVARKTFASSDEIEINADDIQVHEWLNPGIVKTELIEKIMYKCRKEIARLEGLNVEKVIYHVNVELPDIL